MKPSDIVYCAVTNSVLFARDALFDADGRAYRPEEAPEGAKPAAFDADEDLVGEGAATVDAGVEDAVDGIDADATVEEAAIEDDEDEVGDEDLVGEGPGLESRAARRRRHRGR